MFRIVGDCWRSFVGWARRIGFRRRWKGIYETADRLPMVDGLFLSICDVAARTRVIASVNRTWPRIPATIQNELVRNWKVLQRRWDQRQVGIVLHLPIFGVFDDCFEYAADHGTLIGSAWRASAWNGFADSGDSLYRMFDLLYLPVWSSDLRVPDEFLDLKIARRFASYHLCAKNGTRASSLLCGCAEGTDELMREWGFPVDAYNEWYERELHGSTKT